MSLQGWILHALFAEKGSAAQVVRRLTAAGLEVNPGSVHVTFARLKKLSLAVVGPDGRYALTPGGRAQVKEERRTMRALETQW